MKIIFQTILFISRTISGIGDMIDIEPYQFGNPNNLNIILHNKYLQLNKVDGTICFLLQEYKIMLKANVHCVKDFSILDLSISPYKIETLVLGLNHLCILQNFEMKCWSEDKSLKKIPDSIRFTGADSLTAGMNHSCAKYSYLEEDTAFNEVACWGHNSHGQLDIPGFVKDFIMMEVHNLSSNFNATCINAGRLVCWGQANWMDHGLGTAMIHLAKIQRGRRMEIDFNNEVICVNEVFRNDGVNEKSGNISHTSTDRHPSQLDLDTNKSMNKQTITKTYTSSMKCYGHCQLGMCDLPDVTNIFSLSVGASHACVINPTDPNTPIDTWAGEAICWGSNLYGQLLTPTHFEKQTQQVQAGNGTTCAMLQNFHFNCWGKDGFPDRLRLDKESPQQKVNNFARGVSVGSTHSCTITNGHAECWGGDEFEQTQLMAGNQPYQVLLEAGSEISCQSDLTGQIKCVGINFHGQSDVPAAAKDKIQNKYFCQPNPKDSNVNNDTNPDTAVPPTSTPTIPNQSPLSVPIGMTVGATHTCVITHYLLRRLTCWGGHNEFGQIDTPTLYNQDVLMVSAGDEHTCVILHPNRPYAPHVQGIFENKHNSVTNVSHTSPYEQTCWGSNVSGQIDLFGIQDKESERAIQISAGGDHTCILFDNGNLNCVGSNSHGQLDVQANLSRIKNQDYLDLNRLTETKAQNHYHLEMDADIQNNHEGDWSDSYSDSSSESRSESSTHQNDDSIIKRVSAGVAHTCLQVQHKGVSCFGMIENFKLGSNHINQDVIDIKSGWENDCLVNRDGDLDCRGSNEFGQCDKDKKPVESEEYP